MTENDLYLVKLSAKLLVVEMALQEAFLALAKSSPSASQSLQDWANRAEEKTSQLTIPGFSAEMSDLLSAEYQDALSSFVTPFKG